jgi:NifU-like protein
MLDELNAPKNGTGAPEPTPGVNRMRPASLRAPQARAPRAQVMEGETLEKIALIEKAIEDLRPFLKRDGGDCELVDVEGNTIYVKLTGACVGCHMASMTIAGVQERLIASLGVPLRVVPVG